MASFLRKLINRTPVPYTSSAGSLSIPWAQPSGQVAQMRAMGSVGTLFAIVNRLSNATSQVEWKLYRKPPSGAAGERVEVTRHAALDLWNQPNPFYTRQAFIEGFEQHLELTGEAWWVVSRNGRSSLPLELWFVRPDRMAPVPSPTDFITGYVYTGPAGERVPLETTDVVFLRTPNPLDPYRGMGAVQTVLADLDSTRYSAEWNRNFFINGAEPGGIIEIDRHLDDVQFNELRDRWAEQHKGVANAHKVALLEHGAKWVERKFTQRDMQFAELRQQSSEFIREAFGFPKPLLGTVEDVNRANAEAAEVVFARWLIVPRLERIKQALNSELLPLYGTEAARDLEFDYDNPVPEDKEAANEALKAKGTFVSDMVGAGFDPAGVLLAADLPPIRFAGAQTSTPARAPSPPAARLDIHHHAQTADVPRPAGSFFDMARARRPRAQTSSSDDDLETIREDFEQALADLMERWDGIEDGWYDSLEEQIARAVDGGDLADLGALTVAPDEGTLVLRRALAGMAKQAAARMVEEAAAQGVKLTAPRVDPDLSARAGAEGLRNAFGSDLIDVAAITAQLLANGTAAAAGREALRLATPGVKGRAVAGQVVAALRSLKNWFRRDQLGGALHRAQNEGRIETLAAAPKATYRASEKNDGNTCDPCEGIDGTVFDDLAAVRAAYGTGGYVKCQGGIRCRGTVVAEWE